MYIGHVLELESLFNYSIGNTSYSVINDGYLDHEPIFSSDLINDVPQQVIDTCQSNLPCIYDSTVTGSMSIGLSTLEVSMTSDDIIQTLGELVRKINI